MMRIDKTRTVKEIMCPVPASVDEKMSVSDVSRLMARKKASCIIVKRGDRILGIVTERDIVLKAVSKGADISGTPVRRIMSKPLISVKPDNDLFDALNIMKEKNVKRLAVLSGRNKVGGIITHYDITVVLYEILKKRMNDIRALFDKSQKFFKNSIRALFQALDAKDHYTGTHSRGVAELARAISEEMGLEEDVCRNIYLAGLFHDIGKIYISARILNKKGPLEPDEYAEVKQHPLISEMILRPVDEFGEILPIIRHHHEWYNGSGYPDGIKKNKIPIGALIINVADCYNAMITNRPYRKGLRKEYVINILKQMSGKQFSPRVVKACLKVLKKNREF
ncbi:MAG: HD domain-containing phosphohydrolase [Candidatus Omnitrophota bacterium]